MSKEIKTYLIHKEGMESPDGPYLSYQIVKMSESGLIRADDKIECVNSSEKGTLVEFLASIDYNADYNSDVKIQDVNMPFASMVGLMVKWAFATIPALIIIGFIAFVIFTAFGAAFMSHRY